MSLPAIRGFVFAPIAAAIIEGVARFDIGAYAFALIVVYPLTVVLGIPVTCCCDGAAQLGSGKSSS